MRGMAEDDNGNIWLGTTGGEGRVQMYDIESDTVYHFIPVDRSFPGLSGLAMNAQFFDEKTKILWAGGNSGLVGFNTMTKKYIRNDKFRETAQTLSNVIINDLNVDKRGFLWKK